MASAKAAVVPPARRDRSHWLLSALILVGFGVSAFGLSSLLKDALWWLLIVLVVVAVLLAAAVVRQVAKHRGWAILAGFGAGVASITLLFAPGTALLGFIPTPDTLEAFRKLERAGFTSIAEQSTPAEPVPGILYLLCVGAAALAVTADALAHQAKSPALAGIPFLVLLLVPSFVDADFSNVIVFVETAIVWLAMVALASVPRRAVPARLVLATGATGIGLAVLLPLVLPSLDVVDRAGAGGGPVLNPILNLGADLRRTDPSLALTYTTSTGSGQYLRLTTLVRFSGESWEPSNLAILPSNEVEAIDPLGLASGGAASDIPVSEVTTSVAVEDIVSRWIPVPWIPTSITGLEGFWGWEVDDLTIRSETESAGGQVYEVQSLAVAPTVEQLRAAGTTVAPGFSSYLDLPDELPAIVGETAIEVAGDAVTNYDKAVALQAFFRGSEFAYSEDAPVEAGYDGSGAQVLGEFLEVRAGYCVHFSSAMAAMARSLDIPARVVVGFTPGVQAALSPEAVPESARAVQYRVFTNNLHAWPELHFEGIGWVRFEPTPGRGLEAVFAPSSEDDPATPDVDESVPPELPAPEVPGVSDVELDGEGVTGALDEGVGDAASANMVVWAFFVALGVALVVAPWALRLHRRRTRLAAARLGSARAAWDELAAVVTDLGLPTPANLTPRQLADDLGPRLDDGSRLALIRLRAALEAESFAGVAAAAGVSARAAGAPGAGSSRAAPPLVADLRVVVRSLRRRAGVGARLVATVLPRSLVVTWLPQLVSRPSSAQ